MSFAVLGPGGIGGLLAALLSRAGDDVVVLARDSTARVIAEKGITVESPRFGTFTAHVGTAGRLEEPVDACFVAVKSTHLAEALGRVPAAALGRGLVIPLLNGLEHVELLRVVYPDESVVAGAIRIETDRPEAGLIRHASPFAAVDLAASDANRDRVEMVAAHLKAAGLSVRVRDDEEAMLWEKFVMLLPLALLTTDERDNLGAIRTRRRSDLVAVVAEAASVARAEGIAIDPDLVMRGLDSAPETLGSSMQRDQAAGRPLELDSIGGALLRRASRAGVAVPVTARLVAGLEARAGGCRLGR
ncbi:MAG TPA: 2-dehydropantoate 2-reductase [Patescibacteria group bacterium]|nr:2-dehydropantoate 2-reductase [Patescibacteria group bacterium]